MAFYSASELCKLGFKYIGKDVKISDRASIYNPSNISVGDYSRIDDFCVLSAGDGGIHIWRNVHIAVFSTLIGKGTIKVDDFANISSRVSIYSSNDDYSGAFMTNPTIPGDYTNVEHKNVYIGKHAIVGSGSVILPGVCIGTGVAVGALSLINESCEEFAVYVGIPAKKIKTRLKNILDIEKQFLAQND